MAEPTSGLRGLLGLIGLASSKTQAPSLDDAHMSMLHGSKSFTDYTTNRFASGMRDSVDEAAYNQHRMPPAAPAPAPETLGLRAGVQPTTRRF